MPEESAKADKQQDVDIEEAIGEAAIVNAMTGLKGARFPAQRTDLIRKAQENQADPSVVEELERLPEDRWFDNPRQLIDELARETHGL